MPEDTIDYFINLGSVVALPCALLIMAKWPRSRVPMAILAMVGGSFYALLAICAFWIVWQSGPESLRALVAMEFFGRYGGWGGAWLGTAIAGFVWAARTKRGIRNVKLTSEGEE